jgi:hypothetical protein
VPQWMNYPPPLGKDYYNPKWGGQNCVACAAACLIHQTRGVNTDADTLDAKYGITRRVPANHLRGAIDNALGLICMASGLQRQKNPLGGLATKFDFNGPMPPVPSKGEAHYVVVLLSGTPPHVLYGFSPSTKSDILLYDPHTNAERTRTWRRERYPDLIAYRFG